MDKENSIVFSVVAKAARRLAGQGSPKSEPHGNRPSAATVGVKAIGAAAKWHSESPARNKAQKQRGNDSPSSCHQSRPPLSPLDANLRPSSQKPTPSYGKLSQTQCKSSTVSKQLDFVADFPDQPGPSVTQALQAAAATPTDDEQFEDQNGSIVRRQPPSAQEMAARALQSLHIDHEEDGEDKGNDNDLQQQRQLLLGSKILAAEASHGPLSSSLSLSETTSEGAEGEAGAAMDPEKAMQGAWRSQDPSSDLTDDFEIFCDETQCSYRAPEPIHALHGFPAPGPAPVQQGCAPKSL